LIPPGSELLRWSATPSRKALPLKFMGKVVTHSFRELLKVVVAVVAVGDRITSASGASTV
jgi:hypothetical protein